MAILKAKEISKMNENEIKEKLKELKAEMLRARVTIGKAGKANLTEIKKAIARLMTHKNNIKKEKINKTKESKK